MSFVFVFKSSSAGVQHSPTRNTTPERTRPWQHPPARNTIKFSLPSSRLHGLLSNSHSKAWASKVFSRLILYSGALTQALFAGLSAGPLAVFSQVHLLISRRCRLCSSCRSSTLVLSSAQSFHSRRAIWPFGCPAASVAGAAASLPLQLPAAEAVAAATRLGSQRDSRGRLSSCAVTAHVSPGDESGLDESSVA